jgi:hypothetical protein
MQTKVLVLVATFILLAVYLAVPPLVAAFRRHPERKTIYKLTPLTLLSFLLWVALIAWAGSKQHDDALIQKYVRKLRDRNLLPWVIGSLVALGVVGSLATMLR